MATPEQMPPRKTLTSTPPPAPPSHHKTVGYRVAALRAAVALYGPMGSNSLYAATEVVKTAEIFEYWIGREDPNG